MTTGRVVGGTVVVGAGVVVGTAVVVVVDSADAAAERVAVSSGSSPVAAPINPITNSPPTTGTAIRAHVGHDENMPASPAPAGRVNRSPEPEPKGGPKAPAR